MTGASFNGFDVASLQHNVHFGDLQSITGAQVPPFDQSFFMTQGMPLVFKAFAALRPHHRWCTSAECRAAS